MTRKPEEEPPKGFRKAIPEWLKDCLDRHQKDRCAACGEPMGPRSERQYDHMPALGLRLWDAEKKDTIPRSNDPWFIFAKHTDCHRAKVNKGGRGDTTEVARTRRLSAAQEKHRQAMLSPSSSEEASLAQPPEASKPLRGKAKPKQKIPSRPFPKRK